MKKLLIILGCVLVVVSGVVLLLFSGGNSHNSVARDFAEALLVEKDAEKAYSFTGEEFRKYATVDRIKTYTDKLDVKVPGKISIKKLSSEKVALSNNFPETYKTKFIFDVKNIDWLLSVTTYKNNKGTTVVHAYAISPYLNKGTAE